MRSDVSHAFAAVRTAIASAGDELPEPTPALQALEDAEARHRIVAGHTVAALVGGTGSGKSTLFNALTGSQFADPGPARPSTRETCGCAWGSRADELFDFLGVRRRMLVDTLLQYENRPLDGLVLLDLPDHDSVDEGHAAQVDRLLPVVDLLIWVVDPQKYADHILHEVYLDKLRARADAMVLVLNHADTLDPIGQEAIVADIRRIFAAEGLTTVPVLTTSGTRGDGIAALRDAVVAAVAQESTADRTAAVALDAVAREALRHVGPPVAALDDGDLERAVDELLRATGVDAVAASISSAVARARHEALVVPQRPARAAVAAIGSSWTGRATADLPPLWARAIDRALPSVDELQAVTAAAVASIPLPEVSVRRASVLRGLALAAGVAAAALLVGGLAFAWPVGWLVAGPLLAGGLAGGLLGVARSVREAEGRMRATAYEREVREALTATAVRVLAAPARAVLERHDRVGRALASALRPSTDRGSAPISPT